MVSVHLCYMIISSMKERRNEGAPSNLGHSGILFMSELLHQHYGISWIVSEVQSFNYIHGRSHGKKNHLPPPQRITVSPEKKGSISKESRIVFQSEYFSGDMLVFFGGVYKSIHPRDEPFTVWTLEKLPPRSISWSARYGVSAVDRKGYQFNRLFFATFENWKEQTFPTSEIPKKSSWLCKPWM